MKEKLKQKKGITLIALVITIIVLLILAGVSIAMLTGENGILTQAQRAKEETENAAQNEAIILNEYNNTLDNWINGETTDVSIPEGLEIGAKVTYEPSGTYTWKAKYYSSDTNDVDIKLDSSIGEFNINVWRIFEIDEKTGNVLLVPSEPTIGKVKLYGAQGYNNAVYLLNEACSRLYGNKEKGIEARSINIEDIEEKMTDKALVEAHNFSNAAKYGQQETKEYSQEFSFYPSIYALEMKSVIEGNEKANGVKLSEQTSLIDSTDGDTTNGYIQSLAIHPYQTFWGGSIQNVFENIENSKYVSNYYDLVVPTGKDSKYWVASRCIATNWSNCFFRINVVIGENMYYYDMFNSNKGTYGESYSIFPIISLNSRLISGNETDGFMVE